uniref:CCHC-type domain-containing protein n=1 Tax=Stomoxys calcitrans TaxID=35570 RepID=A0A1I8PRY2_STOCA
MNDESASVSQRQPTIEELKQQRGSSKGSMTRIKNVIESNTSLSHTELECRLGIIESYYKQASFYQNQIERLSPKDPGRHDIDELYVNVKSLILTLIGKHRRPSFSDQSFMLPQPPPNRLPNLKLPKFDGKYLEYKNFINCFNNLVHKDQNIPTSEKFNHLLSCLSGEALATVKAFQVTDENYPCALQRLKERYDNDTLIFLENVTSMFDISKSNKPVPKQLRNIVDTISALYSSLKSLGSYEQICDAFIIHLAMSKVDSETKQRWDEFIDYSKLPSWTECCAMLDRRCQQLDAQCRRSSKQFVPNTTTNYSHNNKQHSFVTKHVSEDVVCTHCSKSGHLISTCQRFIVLTPNQRMEQAKQQKLCLNCLSKGHVYIQCPSKYSCRFCKQRHHSLLHKQIEELTVPSDKPSPSSAATHGTFQNHSSRQVSNVILATALVLVRDSEGKYQLGRALLDSCSQVNFISESLCRSLNLKKCANSTDISGVGSSILKVAYKTQTTVRSRLNNFNLSLEFLISRNITGYHPDENISINDFNLPPNIDLADPDFHRRRGIDMLLGAESFFSLLSVGQIRLGENLPTLQKTLLGWVVSGKYLSNNLTPLRKSTYSIVENVFQELNKNVEMLWKIDFVEGKRQNMTLEQQECETHFLKTVSVQPDGRIIVKLPLKGDPKWLGDSKDIALRRFLTMERKLNRNPDLKKDYTKFLNEYEEMGHMSQLDNADNVSPNYYIPHHCVLRPNSVSTKLRVVFDASCRSSSQLSLNEIMMVGPTIQNNLLIT